MHGFELGEVIRRRIIHRRGGCRNKVGKRPDATGIGRSLCSAVEHGSVWRELPSHSSTKFLQLKTGLTSNVPERLPTGAARYRPHLLESVDFGGRLRLLLQRCRQRLHLCLQVLQFGLVVLQAATSFAIRN